MTRRLILIISILLLSILLSSCGVDSKSNEEAASAIYTSVAMTLTAAAEANSPTPTPEPSSTPTPAQTLTLIPTTKASLAVLSSAGSVSSVSYCDASLYVSDATIPDGTVVYPGQSFTKTWNIQNSGTCTWSSAYSIAYVSGNSMSGATTYLTDSVAPNSTASVSISMIAPTTAGIYIGYWKLQNASSTFFGSTVYVQIVVSSSTATTTSTPTSTSEAAATSTTAVSTATPAPTSTPATTDTPEPTAASADSTSS